MALNAAQSYSGATIIAAGGTLQVNTVATSLPPIRGLAYHLDASSAANLSNSGGAVTNGGSVSQWNDISGDVRELHPVYASLPTYLAGGINGLGVVNFNGGSNLATSSPATVQTVFIVNQPNSYNHLGGIWGDTGGFSGIREDLTANPQWRTGTIPGGDFGSYLIDGVPANPASFTVGQPEVLECVCASPQAAWTTALGWYGQTALTTAMSARSSSITAR